MKNRSVFSVGSVYAYLKNYDADCRIVFAENGEVAGYAKALGDGNVVLTLYIFKENASASES